MTLFKNDLVCIAGQHYVTEGARQSLRTTPRLNLFLALKMTKQTLWVCVFLSFFSLGLGLLGFEPETPTGSTLLGLSQMNIRLSCALE